jgi:tetratricopeptide (TPR) repeat protein
VSLVAVVTAPGEESVAESSAYAYRVFLSYSDRDKAWARWLQAALENFPIDKALVGRETQAGPVPRTLRPIYRDCETAAAGGTLNDRTLAALRKSQHLVVLCSPQAAKSHRVNEQIRRFVAMGRADRVISVVIDGEPGTARECFPPALRPQSGLDRPLIDRRGEPAMADAWLARDGRKRTECKVAAALLCLGLDEVERRTGVIRRRRTRVRCSGIIAAVVALSLACDLGLVWTRSVLSRNEARLDLVVDRAAMLADGMVKVSRKFGILRALSVPVLERSERLLLDLAAFGRDGPRRTIREASMRIESARRYAALGRFELSASRLAETERLLLALTGEAGNSVWRRELPVLYARLGAAQRAQARFQDALASYRSSLAITERLASDPGNVDRQHELALRYLEVGDAHLDLGALRAALTSYNSGLIVAEYLAAVDSGKARWQHDLLLAHEKIGDAMRLRGDLAGALASYNESRAVAERLIAGDPVEVEWQHSLLRSRIRIADVLASEGRSDEALAGYRAGNAIATRLLLADPDSAERQRDLGVGHERIGAVLEARGEFDAALVEYRLALTIARRVADADPDNASWQHDLAIAHRHVGDLARSHGALGETLEHYAASHEVVRRLAAADPGHASRQYDLGASHARMGAVLEARGDLAAAITEYEACVRIGSGFAAGDPDNARTQSDLAVSYQKLAALHHRLGRSAQALLALRQGRVLMDALRARTPESEQWREGLAYFEDRIAALEGRGRALTTAGVAAAVTPTAASVSGATNDLPRVPAAVAHDRENQESIFP